MSSDLILSDDSRKRLYGLRLAAGYLAILFWYCERKPWTNTYQYFIVQDASLTHRLATIQEACYP